MIDIGLGIPQAVGITGALTDAGLTSAEVHRWFETPRRELGGLCPETVLGLPDGPAAVLAVAYTDAEALKAAGPLPERWEREGAA